MSKNKKMDKVSSAILGNLVDVVSPKLVISEIAKGQGVSRGWIYKYFGSSEEEIVLTAIDCLTHQVTELFSCKVEVRSKEEWNSFFLDSLEQTLHEVENFPELYNFFFLSTLLPNRFTKQIRHHEALFIEHRVVPTFMQLLGCKRCEAESLAKLTMVIRAGLVFYWIQEEEKTKEKREDLLETFKKHLRLSF